MLDWFDENQINCNPRELAMNSLGGTRAVDRFFENQPPHMTINLFKNYDGLKTNPHIKLRHLQQLIDDPSYGVGAEFNDSFVEFVDSAPQIFDAESTEYLLNKVDWSKISTLDAKAFLKLKHIGKDHFDQCFNSFKNYPKHFLPNTKFNPGFLNEKFGHQKLLEQPASTPDGFEKTINQQALPKKFVDKKGVKQLEAMIPHVGESIDYKTLKQKDPSFDKMPEVKALFQKNHKVTPEMIASRIEELTEDGYHLTFSKWSGAQRHMADSTPNLVVQLNTSAKMRSEIASDPKRLAFYNMINEIATRTHPNNPEVGGHPNTPHIVSWVRVDVRDTKNWIVEEFQSDFTSALIKEIKSIKEKGHSTLTDDQTGTVFTVEDCIKHAKDLERIMGDWGNTSITGMEEFAKAQGAENIFIHGVGVRAKMSGLSHEEEGSSKLEELYFKNPKKHSYEEIDYDQYPHTNAEHLGKTAKYKKQEIPNKCWRKKLT
jgi:hypothetical protein